MMWSGRGGDKVVTRIGGPVVGSVVGCVLSGRVLDGLTRSNMLRMVGLFAAVVVVVSITVPAVAQEVVYKQRTVVDFGDDTIDGSLAKPDGAWLEARKRLRHLNLIKVRESFRTEILQSVRGL